MMHRWFYAHDGNKIGPFSDRQLMDLAVAGEILRTDTIWKEGVDKGVLATRVQYLFPAIPTTVSQPAALPLTADTKPAHVVLAPQMNAEVATSITTGCPLEAAPTDISHDIGLLPEVAAPVAPSKPKPQEQHVQKRRAVAVTGAIIVGQDGANVKFRKKCTACNHEDSAWSTMPITIGSIKTNFFCPKCRKRQGVALLGSMK